MKVTAENLDSLLSDHGNLMLVRIMDDGAPHVGRLRRTEVADYGYSIPVTYAEGDQAGIMAHLTDMLRDVVALVHILPNNPPEHRYVVKYGEVW